MERLGVLCRHLSCGRRPCHAPSPDAAAAPSAACHWRRSSADDTALDTLALPTVIGAATTAGFPRWAELQRELIETMDAAVPQMVAKYSERGGALYFAEDYDDLYEVFATWGLLYAIGGIDSLCRCCQIFWHGPSPLFHPAKE